MAVMKGCNLWHLLLVSMLDFSLVLWMKSPVVDRIHPQNNKFVIGVETKVTAWWLKTCEEQEMCSSGFLSFNPLTPKGSPFDK